MALTQLDGIGMYRTTPVFAAGSSGSPVLTNMRIDASTEKIAFVGNVWFAERTGTKHIRRVWFRLGSTVTPGATGSLTGSLQTVSTAGQIQPDETQDETFTVATGDLTANANIRSDALSADREVSFAEQLAITFEYDTFDSSVVEIRYWGSNSASYFIDQASPLGVAHKTASWGTQNGQPLCVLEFSDGTYGLLGGSHPYFVSGSTNFNSGSTPDEQGVEWVQDITMKIDALLTGQVSLSSAAADYDVVLYEGSTAIQTVSVDGTQRNTQARPGEHLIEETTLTAGNTYRLMLKPTAANNITINHLDLADAGHRALTALGSSCGMNSRTDGGSFGTLDTDRVPMGFGYRVSSIHDGAGGGGGSETFTGSQFNRGFN